jgi:hypothetical protein
MYFERMIEIFIQSREMKIFMVRSSMMIDFGWRETNQGLNKNNESRETIMTSNGDMI